MLCGGRRERDDVTKALNAAELAHAKSERERQASSDRLTEVEREVTALSSPLVAQQEASAATPARVHANGAGTRSPIFGKPLHLTLISIVLWLPQLAPPQTSNAWILRRIYQISSSRPEVW